MQIGIFGGPMQIFMVYGGSIDSDIGARYSVMGIAYNMSQALFGGTAPIIGTALASTGSNGLVYVAIYEVLLCIISGFILYIMEIQYKDNRKIKGRIMINEFELDDEEFENDDKNQIIIR